MYTERERLEENRLALLKDALGWMDTREGKGRAGTREGKGREGKGNKRSDGE